MNNEPVAWIPKGTTLAKPKDLTDCIPLYTHPVKEQRCSTCDGTGDVHSIDGQWLGECPWCTHPVKELIGGYEVLDTNEHDITVRMTVVDWEAILRKASEK